MPMNLRNGILAGAFALLAVVAAAGWARKAPSPSTTVQPYALNTQPASTYAQPEPQYDAYGRPVTAAVNNNTAEPNPCVGPTSVGYSNGMYAPAYAESYGNHPVQ